MSHALRVGVADQIGYFRAYNTDGSAKTDLTSSTTGLALSVFRVGASAVSISSLSAKAADNTAHADGAIRAVSGNLYTVDLPDAACADQVPSISVKGSYTGGVIEGPEHPLVGYNPASVAVGANTTTPPTVGAIADQVWDEARSGHVTAGTFGEKVNAELDSSVAAQITAIETFATRVTTGLVQDGLVWQFTANMLELGPSSSGGDATLANQTTIIGLINTYLASITAAAQETPGTIAGFPATLNVGDSYTDEMDNAITITLVDDQDNPVDTWGDYDVNHAGFTPTLVISGSGGKVTATVTYDTDHFLVEIPSSESLRASPGTATMQFVLKWYVADRLVAQKTIVTGQAVTWIKQI